MKLCQGMAAVVTGGASGLGEAVVRRLVEKQVKVAVFDMNNERGELLATELGVLYCHVDVSSNDSVETGFSVARQKHGQECILVNCAGVVTGAKTVSRDRVTGEIKMFPLANFSRVIDINLVGTFRCTAHAAAGMLELPPGEDGERGVVVNTASVAAQDGQMGQAAYSASKAGVLGMTLPIARDLMAEGIRVNAILPGLFATPMMTSLPSQVQESLAASVPFPRRLGVPVEFADLVETIITNRYLNGESIRLDGALRLPPR